MATHGGRAKPRALGRHRGHAAAPRHRGVYHYHRQTGYHPHPQSHATRHRLTERPKQAPAAGASAAPVPLQHYQHVTSGRHLASARRAVAETELGQIAAYNAVSGTAMIQLLGSTARLVGPVQVTACAPRDLTLVGASCLLLLLDATNPQDGVVVAIWPPVGSPSGARLTQAGVASIGVTASSSASAMVSFSTAYSAVPVVVATSTDPAWAATVGGVTATGFTLTIHAASPLTATVLVEWIASGT